MDIRKTNNFKYFRERSGYSKQAVAELLDKTVENIENYEEGTDVPDVNDLIKMTYYYRTSLQRLLAVPFHYKNEVIDDIEYVYSTEKDKFKKYNLYFPTKFYETLSFFCKQKGITVNAFLFYLSKNFLDADPDFVDLYNEYTKNTK